MARLKLIIHSCVGYAAPINESNAVREALAAFVKHMEGGNHQAAGAMNVRMPSGDATLEWDIT